MAQYQGPTRRSLAASRKKPRKRELRREGRAQKHEEEPEAKGMTEAEDLDTTSEAEAKAPEE